VAPVELGVGTGELEALVGDAGFAALEGETGDQVSERVGVVEQPLEVVGAAQGSGQAPDRLAGLGRGWFEPPGGRLGRLAASITGSPQTPRRTCRSRAGR